MFQPNSTQASNYCFLHFQPQPKQQHLFLTYVKVFTQCGQPWCRDLRIRLHENTFGLFERQPFHTSLHEDHIGQG